MIENELNEHMLVKSIDSDRGGMLGLIKSLDGFIGETHLDFKLQNAPKCLFAILVGGDSNTIPIGMNFEISTNGEDALKGNLPFVADRNIPQTICLNSPKDGTYRIVLKSVLKSSFRLIASTLPLNLEDQEFKSKVQDLTPHLRSKSELMRHGIHVEKVSVGCGLCLAGIVLLAIAVVVVITITLPEDAAVVVGVVEFLGSYGVTVEAVVVVSWIADLTAGLTAVAVEQLLCGWAGKCD